MAKIYATLDTRRPAPNGECYIRICISHNGSTSSHSFGYSVQPEQWDKKKRCVIGIGANSINRHLETTLYEMRIAMFEVQRNGMTATELKEAIINKINPKEEEQRITFIQYFQKCTEERKGSTKKMWTSTLNHLRQYDKNIAEVEFEDITPAWLRDFENYLSEYAPSNNGRWGHFKNIRTAFNSAIENELTSNYPFKKFKIHFEETIKRSLSVDELREIAFAQDVPKGKQEARDIFMLQFYLCGINIKDLMHIEQLYNGRIIYTRFKTGKQISIKVEPEAKAIIQKYAGAKHIINAIERVNAYGNYAYRINEALKYFTPTLTTYWARHTWATIASELDIPNEIIAAALGHTYGNQTTSIYIRLNQKKVDDANRRVIDYVLYDKK